MAAGASPPRGPDAPPSDEDKRLETVRLDALAASKASPEVTHRAIARRLLRSGQPDKAAAELIRFAREQPMTARTAQALVTMALATNKMGPLLTLVTQGVDEVEGRERVGVLRALARLQRRTGQELPAIETLTTLLAEAPEDRRSRLVLNALLERFERWDELDASLEKETRLLLRRRYFRAASRVALKRARLWGERLQEHPRAALRYGQAAQYAEQGQDPHSVFLLRMLWLRALVHADSPARSIDEAVRVVLDVSGRVGKDARARAFIRELGLQVPAPKVVIEEVHDVTSSGEEPTAAIVIPPPSTTQSDFEAAEAEPAPQGQVGEALLVAAAASPSASNRALTRLEARYVARGAWRELARFYQETAAGRADPKERAAWLEKLAELLESELDDAVGAAKMWAEVAQLTGDTQAVSEQVRILDERQDQAGVKQALDAGVVRAQDPNEKARLLVLRAHEARTRGDSNQAKADFEEALRVSPTSLEAAAGLAELLVVRGDVAPVKTFEKLLLAASRRLPERGALFRRLAKLADAVKDARLALTAWVEVVGVTAQDDEALSRLWVLAKGLRDDARLEQVLKALLAKDPRGEKARPAWLDLVSVLERGGRFDEALTALREAVKAEPGHLQAWLSLVDRLLARRLDDEAGWALEHAATSAPEGPQRVSLWRRLARHARERLNDEERAEKYEERIERVRVEQAPAAHAAAKLPGGPLVVPAPRASRPKPPSVLAVAAKTLTDEVESEAFAKALGAVREPEDSRPPLPPKLPARLQRVLDPIVHAFTNQIETREAPASDFADDDDIDDVMEVRSDEVVIMGPDSGPSVVVDAELEAEARATKTAARSPSQTPPRADGAARTAKLPEPSATPRSDAPSPRAAKSAEPSAKVLGIDAPPARAAKSAEAPAKTFGAAASVARPAKPVDAPPARAAKPAAADAAVRETPPRAAKPAAEVVVSETPPRAPRPADAARAPMPTFSNAHDDDASASPAPRAELAEDDEDASETPAPRAASDAADDDAYEPVARAENRRTQELPAVAPVELGDPLQSIPPSFGPSPSKQLSEERQALFERVRASPLDPDGYRMLAEHFDTANDANRSSLMLELARALEGDPNAAPRTPRLILSATDRAGLRHPLVRTEAAELVTLTSPALCRLFPAKGKDAQANEEFSLESGKGSKVAADALLASVRLLGMRAPDVFVSDEAGPPFSALQTTPPRLVVSRLTVKKPVADAELRFYAGRALFTLSAELLALRTLKRDQLRAGLEAVGQMLRGQASTEARIIREALPARSHERLKALWPKVAKTLDLSALMEGARHSVNRAGLVVCGGIAPAIASLRAKKALPIEVTELVRFAASERYLQLRNRRLGKK
ncbi:MAG: tetratricopeptide repeat protein [Myxococcaceae bacterium]